MIVLTCDTRLGLCAELLALRSKLASVDAAQKINAGILASRRMGAIRRVLLGREVASLIDQMLTPGVAGERLLAELEGTQNMPPNVRIAKAAYARSIVKSLSIIYYSERSAGLVEGNYKTPEALEKAINDILPGDSNGYDRVGPVIDDCVARGVLSDALREELNAATMGGTNEDFKASKTDLMLAPLFEKVEAEQIAFSNQLEGMRNDPAKNHDKYIAFYQKYETYLEEVYRPVAKAKREVDRAAKDKINNAFARVGAKIQAAVMDVSPITPDEATRWAQAQEITPAAANRLRKVGYPVDAVRRDMAEFYRFTHGRVPAAKIESHGDRRANATGIEAHGVVGSINLGSSFDKRVLWHELAHHMEADPVAKMAAGQFIRRRSVDGKSYKLRALANNPAYRSDEVAFKGDFFSPYIGKIYSDGVTEVFAMGVESFSDPETLARRAANDPQTLAFIAGYLKSEIDPLVQAQQGLNSIMLAMKGEARAALENSIGSMQKALADTVQLTPDSDTSWIMDSFKYSLSEYKQIGRFGDSKFYLFSGKVRDIYTKRKCNGLVLAYTDGRWLSRIEIPGIDQTIVKAMYALYLKNGTLPQFHMMNDTAYLTRMSA
jgi:hypothetical protein